MVMLPRDPLGPLGIAVAPKFRSCLRENAYDRYPPLTTMAALPARKISLTVPAEGGGATACVTCRSYSQFQNCFACGELNSAFLPSSEISSPPKARTVLLHSRY